MIRKMIFSLLQTLALWQQIHPNTAEDSALQSSLQLHSVYDFHEQEAKKVMREFTYKTQRTDYVSKTVDRCQGLAYTTNIIYSYCYRGLHTC